MSTYRYRGDLRTTGDQLRLRESGSGNKKPVEVRAEDTSEEIILKTPNSTGMDDGAGDDTGKKVDVLTTSKATQPLENKILKNTKITNDGQAYTIIANDLASPVNITLPNLGAADEFTFNDHAQTLTNKTITAPTITDPSVSGLYLSDNAVVFEGGVDDDFELTLRAQNPTTEDVTVTIPAATDTLVARNTADILKNKTISDLTYGQEAFGFLGQAAISLVPTTVSVLINAADEDARITNIDNSTTKYVVISNTSGNDIQIADTSTGSNIVTGAGGDIPLGVGASTTLIYDDVSNKWRVVGKTGFDGGLSVEATSSNTTAEVGKHYLVNSSGGTDLIPLTITLPDATTLSPSERQGATIRITDAANVCGTLDGSVYPKRIVVASSGSDTINLAESDFSGAEDWSALTSFNMNVSGVWVQLMVKPKGGGLYEWVVDDPFWNTLGEDYVTDETLTAQYYKKTELDSGQLDNRYYTETEVNSALSLKYDASNPDGFETPAELDVRDTANRNRSNHTGTQLASTISDFATQVTNNSAVLANTAKVSADGSISTHSDVNTAGAAVGNTLVWSGAVWIPGVAGASGEVYVHTGNGHGGAGIKIRRFATTQINTGTSITYTDDPTNGASFLINENGIYNITYSDSGSAEISVGVSLLTNINDILVNVEELPMERWVCPVMESIQTNVIISTSTTVRLASGVTIRPHTNGNPDATYGVSFRITQVTKL